MVLLMQNTAPDGWIHAVGPFAAASPSAPYIIRDCTYVFYMEAVPPWSSLAAPYLLLLLLEVRVLAF